MSQQLSPWLEGAYGWNFGESNWNTGIDNNQLKFSFMFDRNIEGLVASLPAAVNGQAYFLTADNRLYFAVGTTWFSTPTPKWFEFTIRSTGEAYQFNGTTAVQIDSPSGVDARMDAIEVTIDSLGTAAFEDVNTLATHAELDVVEAQQQAYTDELRQDLVDAVDPTKGAALVGRSIVVVETVGDMAAISITAGHTAQLNLGARSGIFLHDPTITAPQITSDPGQMVFVASDFGGAWVRSGFSKLETKWVGDTTSASLNAALQLGLEMGKSVVISDGVYTGTDLIVDAPGESLNIEVSAGARLEFGLHVRGRIAMTSSPVISLGDFAVFPVGTTTFPGDFSAYSPGDTVMVQLSAGGSQSFNEAGVDFGVVSTANSTELVLTAGTRLAYRDPVIEKITNAAKHTGTVAKNAITIAGDYTANFQAGDIIRLENVNGTGGVEGSAFYFELARVAGITVSEITLEGRLAHSFVDPWLVKMDSVKGFKLSGGGDIERLQVQYAEDVFITDTFVRRSIYNFIYRYGIHGDYRRGIAEPSTSNNTWMFSGQMSNIHCQGSLSEFDNACFKVMGCPNMQLSNISGSNSTATAQGNFSVFVDYFYTPYKIWNDNLQGSNIRGETPNGGSARAVWVTGIRNANVELSGGSIFVQRAVDSTVDIACQSSLLEVQDVVRSTITGHAQRVTWDGGVDSYADVSVRDSLNVGSNRCFWARAGSAHPEVGGAYTATNNEFDVVSYSGNAADITLYMQSQDGAVVGSKCRDKSSVLASVSLGSAVNTPRMKPNMLTKSVTITSTWSGPSLKGFMNMNGDWRDGGIIVNGNYLWVDGTGKLRIHTGKPAADTNGVVVGTQVA